MAVPAEAVAVPPGGGLSLRLAAATLNVSFTGDSAEGGDGGGFGAVNWPSSLAAAAAAWVSTA